MKAIKKRARDGSEQVLLGAVIMKEKPSRKRFKRHDTEYSLAVHRLREIEKVIKHRHRRGIPDPKDTDDIDLCHAYLRAVAMTPGSQDVSSWAIVWAPWADPVTLDLLERDAAKRKRVIPADAVAKLLYVTLAERSALGLKTIGACDVSKPEREKIAADRKRERDRYRQEQKRREEGRKDRASYEAASLSKLKPWVSEGISRRTWERRRDASLSQIEGITKGDTLASKALSQTLQHTHVHQSRVAGLAAGLGDHPPAELQEAAPHGTSDTLAKSAA